MPRIAGDAQSVPCEDRRRTSFFGFMGTKSRGISAIYLTLVPMNSSIFVVGENSRNLLP